MKRTLRDRVLGPFGISIGTSIALEALIIPDIPREDDVVVELYYGRVKYLFINVGTLTRNIIAAVPTIEKPKIFNARTFKPLEEVIEEEIELIRTLLEDRDIKVFPYKTDFEEMYKLGRIEGRGNAEIQRYLITLMSKPYDKLDSFEEKPKTLITHLTYDLLSRNVTKVIESYTGKVLEKPDFSKRYLIKDKPVDMLPFNKTLLRIFGDKSRTIKGVGVRASMEVYDTLIKNHVLHTRTESWCKRLLRL